MKSLQNDARSGKQLIEQRRAQGLDKTGPKGQGNDIGRGQGDQDRGGDSALTNQAEMNRLKKAAYEGKQRIEKEGHGKDMHGNRGASKN
jgi:hypothetical protein